MDDIRWAEGVAVFLESADPIGLGELRSAVETLKEDPESSSKMIFLFHRDQTAASFRLLESMAIQLGFRRLAAPGGTATAEHMTEMGRKLAANGD